MLDKLFNWFKRTTSPAEPPRPETILVVGGTYRQATQWISDLKGVTDPSKYRFWAVARAEDLRGHILRPNSVVYVGTFYDRPDIEEISDLVAVATRLPLK